MVIDEDPCLIAVVDAVATHPGVSPIVNADRRKGIADDVAVLKLKASLRDVNGVPLAAAGLMQGEVADSPDAGLKVNRIASASANDHIL